MSKKSALVALFVTAMTATSGAFAAMVTPLGSPMDDLGRAGLLALAAAGLVLGVTIVRRKQGR